MYYYIAGCANNVFSIYRESCEAEYQALRALQIPLERVEEQKRCFNNVRRNYNRIIKISLSLLARSGDSDIQEFENAISDYLFSFRKFLDNWETYIKRNYGEDSPLYIIFRTTTASAYDNHDEYKIIYQLRNIEQHVDKVVDHIVVRTDDDGTSYIQANADSYRLMQIYSKWKAVEKEHLQKCETIDVFAYVKVAHACLMQIEKELVGYFLSDELYDSCCRILTKANEFFDHRKELIFLCQEEELTKEFWHRPFKSLRPRSWMVPECIILLEAFLRSNSSRAVILYYGKGYSVSLANVAIELSKEQNEQIYSGDKMNINGMHYLCYSTKMDLINGRRIILAINEDIPSDKREEVHFLFSKYVNALLGKK